MMAGIPKKKKILSNPYLRKVSYERHNKPFIAMEDIEIFLKELAKERRLGRTSEEDEQAVGEILRTASELKVPHPINPSLRKVTDKIYSKQRILPEDVREFARVWDSEQDAGRITERDKSAANAFLAFAKKKWPKHLPEE